MPGPPTRVWALCAASHGLPPIGVWWSVMKAEAWEGRIRYLVGARLADVCALSGEDPAM